MKALCIRPSVRDGPSHCSHGLGESLIGEMRPCETGYAAHGGRLWLMQRDYGLRTGWSSVLLVTTEVLWLIKGLGPGGAERLLVNAAATHDRKRFSFECAYVMPKKAHLVAALENLGVRCHLLNGDGSAWRWPFALRRLVNEGRFKVVHCHSPLIAAVGRLVVRTIPARRRPVVVTTEHNAWSRFVWPTRWANAITSPLDAATIAVSEEVLSSIRGPARRRAVLLHHGIDIGAVRALRNERDAVRTEFGFTPSE